MRGERRHVEVETELRRFGAPEPAASLAAIVVPLAAVENA
jgi:hypothetical protein